MLLIPAIDIRGGLVVRLERGDYARETVYESDPAAVARRWAADGAEWLHVVDLDGARQGRPVNAGQLGRIGAARGAARIEWGGGLRDVAAVEAALEAGADRVVIGSAAHSDPGLVGDLVRRHGSDRVAVGIDTRGGRVAVAGWTEATEATAAALVAAMEERGVERFIYTPVERDGTLEGPDIEQLRAVAGETGGEVVYSGGIGSLDDLRALAAAGIPNLAGAIAGKALYEGRFTLAEGQAALAG